MFKSKIGGVVIGYGPTVHIFGILYCTPWFYIHSNYRHVYPATMLLPRPVLFPYTLLYMRWVANQT